MITEDYVSFETAKLLKEKGFDGDTFCEYADKEGVVEEWYDEYRERMMHFDYNYGTLITPPTEPQDKYRVYGDTIPAPSLALAMKWLREIHHLFIDVDYNEENGNTPYFTLITDLKTKEYISGRSVDVFQSTYELAAEAAIKYCLENLI